MMALEKQAKDMQRQIAVGKEVRPLYIYIGHILLVSECVSACVRECVCVCVSERERESES